MTIVSSSPSCDKAPPYNGDPVVDQQCSSQRLIETMIPKVDRTTILAKVIHNSVVAVGCLHDFARRSGDFDLGAVGDEVVGVG